MQIAITPAQMISSEDASKPLGGEHVRLSGIEAPGSEAFGDLLQGPDDSEEPDLAITVILHSQADFPPGADAAALPNTGSHVSARGGVFPGDSIPVSGHSENEPPVSGGMDVGWKGSAIGGETSGGLAYAVKAGDGNERHDVGRIGERQTGRRDVSNEMPPSVHPAGSGGDSRSDGALSADIGARDGKSGQELVPQAANAARLAQHPIWPEEPKIKPEVRDVLTNGALSAAAKTGGDGMGEGVPTPVGSAAFKEHEKMTGLALREPASAGAEPDVPRGIVQAPQENAPLYMREPGAGKLQNEARNAADAPVPASAGQFSNSAQPTRQKSDQEPMAPAFQEPIAPALERNPPGDMESTGSRAFQQKEKGEQKQAVSFPASESGQSLRDGSTKAEKEDAPAARSRHGHEAAPSPSRSDPVVMREPAAKAASYPGHDLGEAHRSARLSDPAVDVGVSGETREASPAQPASGHKPLGGGNVTVFAAGIPSEVAGMEKARDVLEYSVSAQAEGIGLQSSSGPDAVREIAAVARGHAAPSLPVAERSVIQQIAQAAVQIADRPIELRLDPEELGRVRLVLSLGDHNAITVSIHAERPETLDLIRRNISDLSQEFRDLGYDNPEFSFGSGMNDQQSGREAAPHARIPGADIGPGVKADAEVLRPGPEALVLEMSERLDLRL